jgi:hypothetical protein
MHKRKKLRQGDYPTTGPLFFFTFVIQGYLQKHFHNLRIGKILQQFLYRLHPFYPAVRGYRSAFCSQFADHLLQRPSCYPSVSPIRKRIGAGFPFSMSFGWLTRYISSLSLKDDFYGSRHKITP